MPILTDIERLNTTIAGGKYALDRILGRGGMGTVFEGRHTWTGRRVAIKLLRHDMAADVAASQRYLQEARAATSVEHPNVVEVLDMGRDDDTTVYMVFELLRGESLGDRLDTTARLSVMEAALILLPIADALAAAHELGIVHRDIKPDNIFLEDDGMGCIRPKLLDFGIARITDPSDRGTHTGVVTGTPEYMSPEHAQGYRATAASDVWSLGVVLFESLTGTRPFEAETAVGVLMAIVQNTIPTLRGREDVPDAIADVVERALVRDPKQRMRDAGTFRDALATAVDLECVPSRSRSVPPKMLTSSGEVELTVERRVVPRRSTPSVDQLPIGVALDSDQHPIAYAAPSDPPVPPPFLSRHADRVDTLDAVPAASDSGRRRRRVMAAALVIAAIAAGWYFVRRDVDSPRSRSIANSAPAAPGDADPSAPPTPSTGTEERPEASAGGAVGSVVPDPVPPPPEGRRVDGHAESTTEVSSRHAPAPRTTPTAVEPQAPRAARPARRVPSASPGAQRGANGSLILD